MGTERRARRGGREKSIPTATQQHSMQRAEKHTIAGKNIDNKKVV
jgi:hypothetical protein